MTATPLSVLLQAEGAPAGPDMSFFMFDLDAEAKKHVEEKFWHPQTRREYLIGDALSEDTWKQVKALNPTRFRRLHRIWSVRIWALLWMS